MKNLSNHKKWRPSIAQLIDVCGQVDVIETELLEGGSDLNGREKCASVADARTNWSASQDGVRRCDTCHRPGIFNCLRCSACEKEVRVCLLRNGHHGYWLLEAC